jgi:16S rRNA (adenine1518-N6/adenine1519-N6)-dimethyltransferase
MLQDEVADRLLAPPATKAYGALTVFVRAAFYASRVMRVEPSAFHPAPEVTSAVVRLVPARRAEETAIFRALVRAAFAKRRKTLRNAWREIGPIDRVASAATAAGISLDARGETLDVDAFGRMAKALET